MNLAGYGVRKRTFDELIQHEAVERGSFKTHLRLNHHDAYKLPLNMKKIL